MLRAVIRDERPNPIWDAFRLLREQVERLVAVNLLWSLHLLPGIAGLAFPEWPLLLRTLLVGYSALTAPPATLVVYALVRGVCEGEEVRWQDVTDAFRRFALASFRSLAPLLASLGLLVWSAVQVAGAVFALDILLRLGILFLGVCALYWGPLLVDAPRLGAWKLLGRSVGLVFRDPAGTLKITLASLVTLVVSAVSVGGLFLLSLVLLALFGTLQYLDVRGDG